MRYKYTTDSIKKVKDGSVRVCFDAQKKKTVECPRCHNPRGITFYKKGNREMAHCFHCKSASGNGINIGDPIKAMAFINDWDYEKDFDQCLEAAANKLGIFLEEKKPIKKSIKVKTSEHVAVDTSSFAHQQLVASGLTEKDVEARITLSDGTVIIRSPFSKGGMRSDGVVNNDQNEMLIHYYDLWGKPMTFTTKGNRKQINLVRVRWSNPELHKNADGKPIKYQTPLGATCRFYFPQKIRDMFQNKTPIETLFIQEGEKKAEKACKHGIWSIGISGIWNIGNKETGLIQDLQYLVQECQIRNIVLLMDSDWNNLSKNLERGDAVDMRPRSFSGAVIKFKQYINTLHNCNLSVDTWWAHINENVNDDKGIDDLIVNTFKNKGEKLLPYIDEAMHNVKGHSTYIDVHKISVLSDVKIREFWKLDNHQEFFEMHKEQLVKLSEFKIGGFRYSIENGQMVITSKYSAEGDFWEIEENDKGKQKVLVKQDKLITFLEANGFSIIRTKDCEKDQFKYILNEENIVRIIGAMDIRQFVYSYIRQATKNAMIHSHFADKLSSILDNGRLERLKETEDSFEEYEPNTQHFYFRNCCVDVTPEEIIVSKRLSLVWENRIIKHKFYRVPIFQSITKRNNEFDVVLTKKGLQCEFLQFLKNTSQFSLKEKQRQTENSMLFLHLVNKITAIGFLLNDFKFQSELKCVIAMDGEIGDVGQSNGRTGKSLIGKALSYMMEQAYVDGRNTKNDDEYIYSSITPRTRNVFLDDVRVNFDFERFFSAITADLSVNPKTMARFVVKNEVSPKFYITTNHAINADNRSARERIIYMAFSNWYNDKHMPIDDFGHILFADWDSEQWNLFYNLMIECNHYYLKSLYEGWQRTGQGAVLPPMGDLRKRQLLQKMGMAFYQWADAYFDAASTHLERREKRSAMRDAFHEEFPERSTGVTPTNFKTKLIAYCEFKGFHLNPHKNDKYGCSYQEFRKNNPGDIFVGGEDKTNGSEYFLVARTGWIEKNPV